MVTGEGGRGADGNGIGTSHTAPRRLATATAATVSGFSAHGCARVMVIAKRFRPGFGAKLRCAAALRHPRARPRSLPRAALRAARRARARIAPRVIYLSGAQPGWDQRADWFTRRPAPTRRDAALLAAPAPGAHAADGRARPGRALDRADPEVVVSSEYGPATWRALAWCRRRDRRLVVMSELTPWSDPMLSALQRRVHRWLAPRVDGFVVFSSQGVERLERMGVARERIEVSIQSADLDAGAGGGRGARRTRRRRAGAGAVGRPARAGQEPGRCWWRRSPRRASSQARPSWSCAAPARSTSSCARSPSGSRCRCACTATWRPPSCRRLYREADVLALVSTYEPFGVTRARGRRGRAAADLLGAGGRRRRRGRGRRERPAGRPGRPRPRSPPR